MNVRPHSLRRLRLAITTTVVVALPVSLAVAIIQLGHAADTDQPLAPTAATGLPYHGAARSIADRVADLMSEMTVDEKIGQMTQAERGEISESDVTTDLLGSVLSGGGSAPASNTPAAWADMYDSFQRAALATRLRIPMLYGIDAVHGNNNVYGSTIFPHNIGLGASRNPVLVQQVSRAVAEEVTGAGQDWTFSPCLCVARNNRWGRTYESFGETPELVSSMTTAVTGFQGVTLNESASILATAKHYIGDGGTTDGQDQGNTEISPEELRAVHLPPFKAAVDRGVGSIMVSYSSWNSAKLHGNKYLITDVLKGELGFTGFVISDWAAIDQLEGDPKDFTKEEIAIAVNAGLDMIMVPKDHKRFLGYFKENVTDNTIPQTRIDDAVRRILTNKFEMGLFERPFADRSYASTIGSDAHRELARQAVRESQVLLKNSGDILPLAKTGGKVFVAGKNADDIGNQSGGWTIKWQGESGNTIPGTTVLQGIRNAVGSGSTVTYSKDGTGIDESYRAAIAVVGETPYAEHFGDRTSLDLDEDDLATLQRLKASGVPVITVLVSGRPMDVTAQLPDWSALVAAWLPGSEGAGVADVLFGDAKPTGKLPMTWPTGTDQEPINDGDGKTGLFPYGYGLTYSTPGPPSTPPPAPEGPPGTRKR